MAKNQIFVSPNRWYSLEYPRTWEVQVIDQIPTFFDSIFGRGALQILSAWLAEEPDPNIVEEYPFLAGESLQQKLEIFLQRQSHSFSPENFSLGILPDKTRIVAYEYEQEDRFYLAAMLQKKNVFLLALYNCDRTPEDEEAATVGNILKSITIPD